MKTSCSHASSGGGGGDYLHARFPAVSPLTEVENDRLESCPAARHCRSPGPPHSPTSSAASSSPGAGPETSSPRCRTEDNVSLVCPAETDSCSDELLKEPNNNNNKIGRASCRERVSSPV